MKKLLLGLALLSMISVHSYSSLNNVKGNLVTIKGKQYKNVIY